jgi:hypothetical protein
MFGVPKVSPYLSLLLRACIVEWFPRCPGGRCRSEIATNVSDVPKVPQ